MFAHKGKYPDTRLDSGPAATPQGVDLPLVNGSDSITTLVKDMDPDSSVLCDTQVSSNSNTNTSDKTILLGELQESSAKRSLESSVSFQVPNISQNFTLNVSPNVANIASIQNVVPSGNPTLWLPTIITSNTPTTSDDQVLEGQVEGSSSSISQIILSGNGTHSTPVLTTPSAVQSSKYTPKVQILTIPKQGALTQGPPMSSIKSMVHTANLINQNDKTKMTASVSNSVMSNQLLLPPSKNSLHAISFGGLNSQHNHLQSKSSVTSSGLQMANLSSSSSTSKSSNTRSHVLSRVVPGPKLSTQAIGRCIKNPGSTMQYQKLPGRTASFSNLHHSQTAQPSMSVKIIQQQNIPLNNKSAMKPVPLNRTGLMTKQRSSASTTPYNQVNKQGSYSKSAAGINVTKPVGRNIPQRLVVQQTPSRLMMSSNVAQGSYTRGLGFYQQQSNDSSDDSSRYNPHHSYVAQTAHHNTSFNSSTNQSLTAQILQSLSQPKVMSSRIIPTHSNSSPIHYDDAWEENMPDTGSFDHCRQIQGDPSILSQSTLEDTLGTEERPTLPDDSLSYHYYNLQLVMLDHTYSVTPQSVALSSSANINTLPNTGVSSSAHPVNSGSPICSPIKALPSPTKSQSPLPVSLTSNCAPMESNYSLTNVTSRLAEDADDDAGSVLSSIDGEERRQGERNGSDTETAPEGEGEEEGKTRCVCEFTHDDGYMICCDRCGEWQHVDCMAIDRQNIPDDYMCDRCQPRLIDRKRARSIQMRKKEELTGIYSSASDSSSGPIGSLKKVPGNKAIGPQKKMLTVTTYSNTISGVSRTVPMLPPPQSCNYTAPYSSSNNVPPIVNNKRGPKRTRRVDTSRKGPKRKLPEKKLRRKSEVSKYRSKYFSNSSQQSNQWSESYELAMTNHYSPELRAKIARYSSNKIGTNHNVMTSVLTAHFCTTVPHAGSKILIATKDMKDNSPIIELRGKYMLSTQHKPQPQQVGRAGSQRPGPYLFFYKFPKDTTQVCIDTRTYGNEARFVRRSCKPNAELQHCIIKGALHVYLITISTIQSNTEITIRHETSGSYQACACGNPKHCKQAPSSNPDIVHKNNGASADISGRERRGRTRQSSVPVNNTSTLPSIMSPNRKEMLSPKLDKRRKSEPESVIHDNIKQEDDHVSDETMKLTSIKVESTLESDLATIKDTEIKEEVDANDLIVLKDIASSIKEEKKEDVPQDIEKEFCKEEDTIPLEVKVEIPDKSVEESELSKCEEQPLLSPNSLSNSEGTALKNKDSKSNRTIGTRRSSTYSVRTTRASVSTSNANESADEKSDSQTECKASEKDKKMTREERKMQAIVKAFERMEKAQQRKMENRDKQTKRRESDPQQLCSVTSSSESKDSSHGDQAEDVTAQQKTNMKGRPRRRGRSRTTSQSQTKSANRMNSVDSDNIGTSEDEHNPSLMSPSRNSGVSSENYLDTTCVSSTESKYQSIIQTDQELKHSFGRIGLGLSSVCKLVEAAVGPLETTFKSPKTKKAIMNEWLNKSPEPNMSFEIGSPEYGTSDNNNMSDHYVEKTSYLGRKSTESLVKAASTMIGNLSGGIISADSTPEKYANSDPSDSENSSHVKNALDFGSPPIIHSPIICPQRNLKRAVRDLSRDSGEKTRTPKKLRRGNRNLDPSPLKRSLRSGVREIIDIDCNKDSVEDKNTRNADMGSPSPVTACLPPPPQHSAKKRWLRQAISEESDSPTAESPPNEMVTPLKKRRLARESLTSEPSTTIQSEDVQCLASPYTAKEGVKDDHLPVNCVVNDPVSVSDDRSEVKEIELTPSEQLDTISLKVHEDMLLKDCNEKKEFTKAEEDSKDISCVSNDSNEVVEGEERETIDMNMEKKNEICDNTINNENKSEIKCEALIVNSTETSCNSSPVLDEMDDIQKKIHSFHTENIQILKIRNKKQPKEKRKKVNLNFDLSVLDDHTVEVKLKSDKDSMVDPETKTNEIGSSSSVDISSTNSSNSDIPDGALQSINVPEHDDANVTQSADTLEEMEAAPNDNSSQTNDEVLPEEKPLSDFAMLNNNFPSSMLFSEAFRTKAESSVVSESATSVPDINIIKNVIDMTVNLENSVFKDTALNTMDEYKNVEEILSRVNQMDSRNSVLLSGLMKDSSVSVEETIATKLSLPARSNDPRLNPPPSDKPKPIRRKLSITEYRRRHSMIHPSESSSCSPPPAADPLPQSQLSDDEEDISQFEKKLEASLTKLDNIMSNMNMGIFNPPSTVHEKHREKLSERLRREFGLAIPEEETACPPVASDKKLVVACGSSEQNAEEEGISGVLSIPSLSEPPHQRLDG